MRTVTYGAACSLDGFIAAEDGDLDWLHFSKDVQQVTADYWKTVDAVLMGRKTWEFAEGMGGEELSHDQTLRVAKEGAARLGPLIERFLEDL